MYFHQLPPLGLLSLHDFSYMRLFTTQPLHVNRIFHTVYGDLARQGLSSSTTFWVSILYWSIYFSDDFLLLLLIFSRKYLYFLLLTFKK